MIFQLEHAPFQHLSQWHVWRLGLDLAEMPDGDPHKDPQTDTLALHAFFQDLLTDLYDNPQAYGLPVDPYEEYVESRMRLSIDKEKADDIRASRLKVRVAIETGILDFLYQIGQAGQPVDQGLWLERTFFDALVAEKIKKTRNKAFPQKFERPGFVFSVGDGVTVFNERYPGMLTALSAFAKECASIRKHGFYFFRRCDFGVFAQKRLPALEDAMRLVPMALRSEIQETDNLLLQHNFKREIFVADAGGGYRLRYSKKGNKIVYWCRLMSWYSPGIHHNLRWDFDSDLTPRLFARLDEARPGLADRIFKGIKPCEHDYENCMALVIIERSGVSRECCSEAAWDTIGESPADFEDLRLVCCVLDELVSVKK